MISRHSFLLCFLFSFQIALMNLSKLDRRPPRASSAFTFLSSETGNNLRKNRTHYFSEDPSDYLSVRDRNITVKNCPKPNVIDEEKKICFCQKGMANYPFEGLNGVYCQYPQKNQLTSFLWELLTGIGIGHFVIDQNVKGSFKLLLILLPSIFGMLNISGVINTKKTEQTSGLIISILLYLCLFTWLIWWLIDAIMFGLNKYRDSNAVPLKAW